MDVSSILFYFCAYFLSNFKELYILCPCKQYIRTFAFIFLASHILYSKNTKKKTLDGRSASDSNRLNVSLLRLSVAKRKKLKENRFQFVLNFLKVSGVCVCV